MGKLQHPQILTGGPELTLKARPVQSESVGAQRIGRARYLSSQGEDQDIRSRNTQTRWYLFVRSPSLFQCHSL
jgi:hypothetical protein